MKDDQRRAAGILRVCILGAIVYLGAFIGVYLWLPLPRLWGDLVLNLFDVAAGGLAALVAILIWRSYRPAEAPNSIWKYLALGLCSWVVADTVWTVYNLTVVVVPDFSLADLFYLLGYSFLLTAMHRHFRLFFHPSPRRDFLLTGAFVAGMLIADLLITSLLVAPLEVHRVTLGDFISVLYPAADVAIAVASIFFIGIFGRGAFARPWIGLTAFAVADGLFAWLDLTRQYSYSTIGKNIPSVISDSLYVIAYAILAILLLNYYLLVRYGPSVARYLSKTGQEQDRIGPGGRAVD